MLSEGVESGNGAVSLSVRGASCRDPPSPLATRIFLTSVCLCRRILVQQAEAEQGALPKGGAQGVGQTGSPVKKSRVQVSRDVIFKPWPTSRKASRTQGLMIVGVRGGMGRLGPPLRPVRSPRMA